MCPFGGGVLPLVALLLPLLLTPAAVVIVHAVVLQNYANKEDETGGGRVRVRRSGVAMCSLLGPPSWQLHL